VTSVFAFVVAGLALCILLVVVTRDQPWGF